MKAAILHGFKKALEIEDVPRPVPEANDLLIRVEACGECEFCLEGNENLCTGQKITGVTVDGGFAEFVKAPASHVVKIPDRLSAVDAAPLFCAGVTVYRALKQARISPGQRLAIFGIGGLGHVAVQIE